MLRSAQNHPFGWLKVRWQIITKEIGVKLDIIQQLYMHVLFYITFANVVELMRKNEDICSR